MARKEMWYFGAFVFWLISFPMNGFLMPREGGNLLPYFIFPSAVSYLAGRSFLGARTFDAVTRAAAAATALLTILFPFAGQFRAFLLFGMGIASPLVVFRLIALLKASPRPLHSAGIGLALGNALVFVFSHLPSGDFVPFLVISAVLLPSALVRAEPGKEPAAEDARSLGLHLPLVGIFYLIGGLLYAAIMPRYDRAAFHAGIELPFYMAAAFAGIALAKRERDLPLALGILLGALSLSFLLPEGGAWTNLAMYACQASFGLVDVYLLALVLSCGGSPGVGGYALGVQCLAIAAGESLGRSVGNAPLPVIAGGNVVLIATVLVLHLAGRRPGEAAIRGVAGDAGCGSATGIAVAPGTDVPARGGGSPGDDAFSEEKLEALLEDYYGPSQKKLSGMEKRVLFLTLQEKTYREAGEELGISESSVKTYMKRIYEKMGVGSREGVRETLFAHGPRATRT